MSILEAFKTRDGSIYLGGAAVTGLVALLTAVSTVRAYQHEWQMREAVQAFTQGRKDARKLLGELREAESGSTQERAVVRVMLGSYNLDRAHENAQLLETAEKLYTEALEIEPGYGPAALGLACVRLRRAEIKDADARRRDAESAISELRGNMTDPDVPEFHYMEGAAMLLGGQAQQALELLDDPNPSQAPSLQAMGARYWNQGVAELIAGGATAFESFALGYQMRPLPIPRETDGNPVPKDAPPPGRASWAPRILELTYRECLSRPGDKEALLDRAERSLRLMSFYARGGINRGQKGRFLPHEDENPKLHNALGLIFFRAEDYTRACEQFDAAVKATNGKEPLYQLNLAWASYQLGQSLTGQADKKLPRQKALRAAAGLFTKVCQRLAGDKARISTLRLARTNGAAVQLMSNNPRGAFQVYKRFYMNDPNKIECLRDLGALAEYAGNRRDALIFYRQAIDGQHPEGAALEERIAVLGGR